MGDPDQGLSSLYKNSHQVMLLIDPAMGDIVDGNAAACAFYGYSRDELTARKITDINLLSPARTFQEMARTQAKRGNHFYFRHRLANGDVRDVEVYSGPIVVRGRSLLYSIVHDITERRRAEAALRVSEARKGAILEAARDGIIVVDAAGRITEINPAAERMFGYSPAAALGGEIAALIAPPVLRARHRHIWAWYLAAGQGLVIGQLFETTATRADGTVFPIELTITRIPVGGPPLFTAYIHDVSNRKHAEEMRTRRERRTALRADVGAALTGNETTLQSMLQQCGEAIVRHIDVALVRLWTLDVEHGTPSVAASAGLQAQAANPPGHVPVGSRNADHIARERQALLTNDIQTDAYTSDDDKRWARREGIVAFAGYPLLVRDRIVGVLTLFDRQPLPEDNIHALALLADTIGQGIARKELENELRDSEQRFRSTFEQAAIGIVHIRLDGAWSLVNQKLCDILGYSRDELLDRTFQDVAHPFDDLDADREALRHLLTNDVPTYTVERRCRRKDGSYVWTNFTTSLLRTPEGAPAYYISVIEDISERKEAQNLLQEVRDTERRRIARDLHDVVLQDLGYALQSMQLAQSNARQTGQKVGHGQDIDALRRAIDHLRGAIYNLRPDDVPERPLVQRVEALIDRFRRLDQEREIQLVVEPEFPLAFGTVAAEEMLRIIQEALVNVRRHSGSRQVRVALGTDQHQFWIEVADDGRGFDPHTSLGGVGRVGMRERAASLGGELDIQSALGLGTRVRFHAPLSGRHPGQ